MPRFLLLRNVGRFRIINCEDVENISRNQNFPDSIKGLCGH